MSLHGSMVYSVYRAKMTTKYIVLVMHNYVNHTCSSKYRRIIGPLRYSYSHSCESGGISDTV